MLSTVIHIYSLTYRTIQNRMDIEGKKIEHYRIIQSIATRGRESPNTNSNIKHHPDGVQANRSGKQPPSWQLYSVLLKNRQIHKTLSSQLNTIEYENNKQHNGSQFTNGGTRRDEDQKNKERQRPTMDKAIYIRVSGNACDTCATSLHYPPCGF